MTAQKLTSGISGVHIILFPLMIILGAHTMIQFTAVVIKNDLNQCTSLNRMFF